MKALKILAALAVFSAAGCAKDKDLWSQVQDHFRQANAAGQADSSASVAQSSAAQSSAAQPSAAPQAAVTPDLKYCEACLVDSAGRVVQVTDKMVGDLEQVSAAGANLVFVGWAADLAAGEPARSVVLVSGGKVVGAARPTQPRPDVSAALKLVKQIQFGFEMQVPAAAMGPDAWVWMIAADGKARRIDKMFRR